MPIENKYLDIAVNLRRQLHRRPEPGWCEFETTYQIYNSLAPLGYQLFIGQEAIEPNAVMGRNDHEVKEAIQRAQTQGVPQWFIEQSGQYTGLVATFDTGRPGPTLALRFDIDCVMVEETTDSTHEAVVGNYRSEIPGAMHACGHDAHTAVGIALAHWIAEHEDQLCGRFILLFQPGEEGARGALSMAQKGWLDNVDYFFCSHIGGTCKLGEVCCVEDGYLATTKMDIHFEGAPSHAGAEPEKGRSALMAAATAALLMQAIPRHSAGASRISVGTLHAGEGRNVTPVHAHLEIETRGATHEINEYMADKVEKIVKGIELTHEVKAKITKVGYGTTLKTTMEGTRIVREVCRSTPGAQLIECPPPTASEDCTILMRRAIEHGAQCGYFDFGCNHEGHHRANFSIQDTESLAIGLSVYVGLCNKLNSFEGAQQ